MQIKDMKNVAIMNVHNVTGDFMTAAKQVQWVPAEMPISPTNEGITFFRLHHSYGRNEPAYFKAAHDAVGLDALVAFLNVASPRPDSYVDKLIHDVKTLNPDAKIMICDGRSNLMESSSIVIDDRKEEIQAALEKMGYYEISATQSGVFVNVYNRDKSDYENIKIENNARLAEGLDAYMTGYGQRAHMDMLKNILGIPEGYENDDRNGYDLIREYENTHPALNPRNGLYL